MKGPDLLLASRAVNLPLAVEHLREFFAGRGLEIGVRTVDLAAGEIPGPAMADEAGVALVRLDPQLASDWLLHCPVQPLEVSRLDAADVFFRDAGVWRPDLVLCRALHDVIVRYGKSVDQKEAAYVIGAGADLRVVGAVCLQFGFRRVYLVGEDENDLNVQKAWLERLYVSADVMALPSHALTLQTVGASLLVNTLDLTGKTDLASDLAYFNFMRRGGLVMDLVAVQEDHAVLEEAMRAELRVIPPHEVSGLCEWFIVERLGLAGKIPPQEYLNSWFEFLRARNPS